MRKILLLTLFISLNIFAEHDGIYCGVHLSQKEISKRFGNNFDYKMHNLTDWDGNLDGMIIIGAVSSSSRYYSYNYFTHDDPIYGNFFSVHESELTKSQVKKLKSSRTSTVFCFNGRWGGSLNWTSGLNVNYISRVDYCKKFLSDGTIDDVGYCQI